LPWDRRSAPDIDENDFFLEEACLDVLQVMRVHRGRCAATRVASDAVLLLEAVPAMVRIAIMYLFFEGVLVDDDDAVVGDDFFVVSDSFFDTAHSLRLRGRLAEFWVLGSSTTCGTSPSSSTSLRAGPSAPARPSGLSSEYPGEGSLQVEEEEGNPFGFPKGLDSP